MSKGSKPRPITVDKSTFDSNWDNIFKKPSPDQVLANATAPVVQAPKTTQSCVH